MDLRSENYKPNSFIYIESQKDINTFYIIRQGKVQLLKEFTVLEDENAVLGPGDFFGVISCMSSHPRIESAKALGDVSVIVIQKSQFGELIQKNTPIAMKIITSFSKKLRHYDSELAQRTLKESAKEEDPRMLFDIAEYYMSQGMHKKAEHAYQKFLQFRPDDPNAEKAKQTLGQLGASLAPTPPTGTGLQKQYPHDTMIFSEHEPGEDLYIIQQGRVNITKVINNKENMLAVLNPGDIFGEMALLENKPRSASAIANGDCVMLQVNKSNFSTMVVAQPQLATKLIQLLSERIWTVYKQLENLLIKDPMGRLFDTLLTQVLNKRIPIEHRAEYTFDFGPQELTKMIGFNEADASINMRKLFENRKFQNVNGKIHTTDLEELEKQVSYYKKIQEMERKREMAARKMG